MSQQYGDDELLALLRECDEQFGKCTRETFRQLEDAPGPEYVHERFGSWSRAKHKAGVAEHETSSRRRKYSNEEMLDQLRHCQDEHGKVSPRVFDAMEDTASSSAVMRRFGSWSRAKEQAGVDEDLSSESGRRQQYSDMKILQDLRECADRNDGRCTVEMLREEEDLISPTLAVERFGSWLDAKRDDPLLDQRQANRRPRQWTDEELLDLIRTCYEEEGKVTQRMFNARSKESDNHPTSATIRKRFGSWSAAKEQAGVESSSRRYTDEELLEQLRLCKERHGSCTASVFSADNELASPEAVQRRFGSWNNGKRKAGVLD